MAHQLKTVSTPLFSKLKAATSIAALTLLSLILTACLTNPGDFSYDNPQIRAFQKEYTAKFIPSESERRALTQRSGSKVYLITVGESTKRLSQSGRGAAISADGYFLTAYHVVAGQEFFLTDVSLSAAEKQKLQRDGYLLESKSETKRIPGRIVWYDKGADLAVLKFPTKTPNYYSKILFPAKKGSVVYAADDHGQVAIPKDKVEGDPSKYAIGNGPYFSAGQILFSQLFTHGPGVHTIGTSLVARGGMGGMSGGPIVTRQGQLCGILSQVGFGYTSKNNQVQLTVRSTARMLPPHILRSIINKDRRN